MNRRQLIVPLLAAALAFPVFAQQESRAPASAQEAQPTDSKADIRFPGGTVAEYTSALRSAFPGANIAVAPGVEVVRVAPVELTGVWVHEAVIAVGTLSESQVTVEKYGNTHLIDGAMATKRQHAEQRSILRVWALAWLTEHREPKEILSAVQTAVDMVDPGAEIRFHTDTKLLLVKGTPDQISAVDQVIGSMITNIRQIAVDQSAAAVTSEERWKSERQELMARIAALEAQLRAIPPSRRQP